MDQNSYMRQITENAESASSQDILDEYGIVEYTADDVVKEFEDAMAYKQEQAKIFRVLDAADHSDIWKVFNKKIPSFVQTPTSNPITIIKEATKASIMPTSYAGDFRPLTLEAKELANTANKFFQMKWDAAGMDLINNEAADYAYLHGTSGVLFGWNEDIVDGKDSSMIYTATAPSGLQAKAYHPANIFPDPSATSVDEMNYLFFAERKSKAFLRSIPRFARALATIENLTDTLGNTDNTYRLDKGKQNSDGVVTFLICYKKVLRVKPNAMGIPQLTPSVDIIYLAGRQILDITKDIQPARIPFITLYDEKISGNYWGISKCYKVLSLVLTLNSLDSTEATSYFKNQNPPEFISRASGLDIVSYQSKRDNPDAAFKVDGDPRVVQAYAQRPDLPKDINSFRQYLKNEIQQVSGVDPVYLGQSYGSIQTTGGVQQATDRATMRDNTRQKQIDKFIKDELELIIQFYIFFGQRENFYDSTSQKMESGSSVGQEYSFDPISLIGREDIIVNVSNCAPRSNASYEDAAMKLMEMQMKYQPSEHGYPDFITPEELISYLNIPKEQRNVLADRMRVQMENMKLEEYTAVLTAIGTLTQGGMPPEMALQEIVQQMVQSPIGQQPATNPTPQQPMQK